MTFNKLLNLSLVSLSEMEENMPHKMVVRIKVGNSKLSAGHRVNVCSLLVIIISNVQAAAVLHF